MRVTLVTAYFAPEITPVTHLYADLAQGLTALGAQVTVVTGFPSRGLTDRQIAAYAARGEETDPAGYGVLRRGKPSREGRGLFRRGLHFLFGTLSLYRAARAVPTDAYLLGSMPPFLGLVGALLAKRASTVYILQDVFPDTMLLMGKWREGHPVVRLCRWMEKVTYRRNTRFVTLSPDMAATLAGRGVDPLRISVIGNWADTETIRPVPRDRNPLFDRLGLDPDGFYAVYAGTLGVLQRPDLILDAARLVATQAKAAKGTELRDASSDKEAKVQAPVTFLIFGDGALLPHIQQRIRQERIENVRLFPLLPAERSAEVYSLGDVALIPLAKGTLACATPSKTWTAMAAGRPLILTAEEDTAWAKTVSEANCGWAVPPETPAALAACIENAFINRANLPALGANARSYAEKHLSKAEAVQKYFEVLAKE